MTPTSRILSRSALALLVPSAVSAQSAAPAPGNAPATGTLVGWVTDRARCTPVEGARIALASGRTVITDSAGRFAIGGVPAGPHTVRVRHAGYAPAERANVDVPAGSLNDVVVQLERLAPGADAGGTATPEPDAAGQPRVTWEPARPTQGTLFTVAVHDTTVRWRATVAGEPLHFANDGAGAWRALAAAPIDATSSVALSIARDSVGGTARVTTIPVARGRYRLEKLRVAPRFGTRPDSALAERLARESMLARGVACRSHQTPRLWEAPFARPRPGRVTSGFGGGREFNGVVQSRHMGIDLAGAVGAPIRATNRGVVALVGDFHLGGRVVYVDHGAGLTSAYLHMSKPEVAMGDSVAKGQVIGRVGATGRVTGPHLHWIVRYGGVTVDPMSVFLLDAGGRGEPAARPATSEPSGRDQ